MDVKQIKYFLEVSRAGSFTSAAKKLYISVPGLVKSMDKLEEEMGVRLIARTRSGVTLTPAGKVLARYVQPYIRQHEVIFSEVKKADAMREARVELCMTWGLLSFFPRDFLSKFVIENPEVSLNIHNYALEELHEVLLEYRGTVGLYFGEIEDSALQILFHRESPLHALMSENHPLADKGKICMNDLMHQKIIVINSDPNVTRTLIRQLEAAGCPPQIVLDNADWTQTLELVGNAGYITFCLPPSTMGTMKLKTCLVEDLDLTVNFNLAVLRGVALSSSEQRFADYVVKLMNANKGKQRVQRKQGDALESPEQD